MNNVIIKIILHNDILDMTECIYGFIIFNKQTKCLLSKTPIQLNSILNNTEEDIKLEKIFKIINSKYPNTLLDCLRDFSNYTLKEVLKSYEGMYDNISLQINKTIYKVTNTNIYEFINQILDVDTVSCF